MVEVSKKKKPTASKAPTPSVEEAPKEAEPKEVTPGNLQVRLIRSGVMIRGVIQPIDSVVELSGGAAERLVAKKRAELV